MNVLKPVTITDAMLVSSTVPENDYPAWLTATAYAIGVRVIRAHKVYEALQASNSVDPATDAADPPRWLEVRPTNRWAMFDQQVNTQTTAATSIVVELSPGAINAVGLIELTGTSARVELLDGSTVIYDVTKTIDNTIILDWLDYFYEEFDTASVLVFDNVPQYLGGKVRITVTGTGTVGIGGALVGVNYALGETQFGATAGINDYSRKETNAFGATKVVKRAFSKRASMRMMVDTARVRRAHRLLADLRATPCLWLGADDTQTYEPLVVYGFWRDFQLEIPYPTKSLYSLEIEGMI